MLHKLRANILTAAVAVAVVAAGTAVLSTFVLVSSALG